MAISWRSCGFIGTTTTTPCLPSKIVSTPSIAAVSNSPSHSSSRLAATEHRSIIPSAQTTGTSTPAADTKSSASPIEYIDLHHVGFLCENLEKSLEFYCGVLGLELNPDRPEKKLPYRGAWLWVGPGMIHLMELPNPDPLTGRPEHGGRDRHACVTIKDVASLQAALEAAGIPYTASKSGRPAVFTRDPDGNALEFAEPV